MTAAEMYRVLDELDKRMKQLERSIDYLRSEIQTLYSRIRR
jgi:prefoldin subunit 5